MQKRIQILSMDYHNEHICTTITLIKKQNISRIPNPLSCHLPITMSYFSPKGKSCPDFQHYRVVFTCLELYTNEILRHILV